MTHCEDLPDEELWERVEPRHPFTSITYESSVGKTDTHMVLHLVVEAIFLLSRGIAVFLGSAWPAVVVRLKKEAIFTRWDAGNLSTKVCNETGRAARCSTAAQENRD